jgi:integrase/recombinase XerD
MKQFETYLQQRNLSPCSIRTYRRYIHIFFNWLKENSLEAKEITYPDLLNFVKHGKEKGLKPDYIMKILGVVRHYFNYLKYIKQVKTNPANGLYIRGKQRRIPHDLLTAEQLEEIYSSFNQKGIAGKRNKIILGLMVYQGLTTLEVEELEPELAKLRQGKIEIPGTRRSHRRTLKLEAHQMLDLQEYISKTRNTILEISDKESGKLFVSTGNSKTLRGSLDKLMRNLRKKHDYFINAQQLRQSRLAIWVKQYDLRQAQYMAGHKYVSSTERYQTIDLEDLQQELEKHHPTID